MYPRRIFPETLRSLAFGSVTSSYVALGSILANPARVIRLLNTTDQDVYISWDGTNNHQYLSSGSFILIDVSANEIKDDGFFVQKGLQFYVKGTSVLPSTGAIYLESYYAQGGEQGAQTSGPL